jgi:hypothetical protein
MLNSEDTGNENNPEFSLAVAIFAEELNAEANIVDGPILSHDRPRACFAKSTDPRIRGFRGLLALGI